MKGACFIARRPVALVLRMAFAGLVLGFLSIDLLNAQSGLHLHDQTCAADPTCGFLGATNTAIGGNGRPNELFVRPWIAPAERKKLNLTHHFSRHDGKEVRLDEFKQPLVISFVYTRCLNPNKCLAVTTKMADLQRKLSEEKLLPRVRLALITYDPRQDTEEVLRNYAKANALTLDDQTFFLRPNMEAPRQLLTDLGVTASFYSSQVSMHEIKLLIVDQAGALARSYSTLIWNNDEVLNDLRKLLDENAPRVETTRAAVP